MDVYSFLLKVYLCIMEKMWYDADFKIGVLGGGQLGKMLIQAAISYDVKVFCMDNDSAAPCANVSHGYQLGDINKYDDVLAFGKDKDVVTVEIEHVNVEALQELVNQGVKVFPQPHILKMIQDKGLQKEFYQKNNIPTAAFKIVSNKAEMEKEVDFLPFMQKLRKGGYDGKGVYKVVDSSDFTKAFDAPSVLEKFVDFEKELSIIVARNEKGEIKSFPLVECEFSPSLNLVEFLFSPAEVSPDIEAKAKLIGENLMEKLEMVGLLAVELFLTKEGDLLVNEIAPRTHNSGHHTIECNYISQFEQQLRAITNQPLGETFLQTPGVMINLIGSKDSVGDVCYEGIDKVLAQERTYPHIYGKKKTKPGRKMGHVTILADELKEAKEKARSILSLVKVVSK